jgi:hypothetical protein
MLATLPAVRPARPPAAPLKPVAVTWVPITHGLSADVPVIAAVVAM